MVTGRAKRLKELEIGDFESKSVGRLKGEEPRMPYATNCTQRSGSTRLLILAE